MGVRNRSGNEIRQRQPKGSAANSQENTLDQHLAKQPGSAHTQCEANGDFFSTRRAASKQEVRQVDAGNQKHARHGAGQHEKWTLILTTDVVPEREEPSSEAAALGMCHSKLLVQSVKFHLRLSQGYTGLEPAD